MADFSLNLVHTLKSTDVKTLAVAFDPTSKVLACAGKEGCVRIFDVESGELLKTCRQHVDFIYTLAFETEGKTVISAGKDKTLRVWDIETGKFVRDYADICSSSASSRSMMSQSFKPSLKSHKMTVLCVACADGGYMATGGQDCHVKLWKNGNPIRTYDWHSGPVIAVAFQPGSHILFSASKDRTIRSWDEITGAMVHKYQGHLDEVSSLHFLDETHFVTSDISGKVFVWDVEKESPLGCIFSADQAIQCSSLSPDKEKLVLGFDTGDIAVISTKFDGKPKEAEALFSTHGHNLAIRSVDWASDGIHIASGDNEGVSKIWKISE